MSIISIDAMNQLIANYLATQTLPVTPKRISMRTSIKPKTCRYLLGTYFAERKVVHDVRLRRTYYQC